MPTVHLSKAYDFTLYCITTIPLSMYFQERVWFKLLCIRSKLLWIQDTTPIPVTNNIWWCSIYSVPFEVVAFLEELFSPPWLSLEPPRLHQILTLVSRVPHKIFSALRPKKWAFETEQPSPPLRAPEVGALLKPFRAQQDFSTWFLSMISLWNTIHTVWCI